MNKAGKKRDLSLPITNSSTTAPESVPDRETLIRDNQAAVGARRMEQDLAEHHSVSPVLTAGDVDAEWHCKLNCHLIGAAISSSPWFSHVAGR